MSRTTRLIRQTLTVARRDFVATVFTPTFLLFLAAPLLMLSFGAVGGLGAATMGKGAEDKERIYAIVADADRAAFAAADTAMRKAFSKPAQPPRLEMVAPAADPAAQARALLSSEDRDVPSVLYGPLERPTVIHGNPTSTTANYLAGLADQALANRAAGPDRPVSRATLTRVERAGTSFGGRNTVAFLTVFGLFILTLMLAGQTVGTMAEERSNKVIEVLAAAVPLESVFLGKLLGLFGVALLFVGFWGTVVANIAAFLPARLAADLAGGAPAVGMPAYPLLFVAYFTMAYLLLGAVFLGVGAQASTPREIQMLSLPITIFMMAMFGWATLAANQPGSWAARAAEIFPFSSPFAMGARAANRPELWPHLLALAWQLAWVAITITVGARVFRRGVLQSAGPKFRWGALLGRQPA